MFVGFGGSLTEKVCVDIFSVNIETSEHRLLMINFSFAVKTSGYLNTSFGLQQRKLLNLPCEYPVPNTLQHGVGRTQNYQSFFFFFYALVELNPLGAENLPKC